MNTMQQEFDAVVQHLYKQGRPAKEDGVCKYRTLEGLMCAVGCRIPDDMYDPKMDSPDWGVDHVLHKFKLPEQIVEYSEMFKTLQRIHDDWMVSDDGQYYFSTIFSDLAIYAECFNLTYNSPRSEA